MDIRITPRTIPSGDPSRVRVFIQATEPGRVLLSLSIQKECVGASGIVRDDGPPYAIRRRKGGPIRIEDADRQREGFLPAIDRRDSHVLRFQRARPDRLVVAITGCGNLQCNPGVEARTRGVRAGIGGFMRAGIHVQPDGRGRMLEGRRVASALATDVGTIADSPDRFVITGPVLVAGGQPVEPDAREFADLRHLLLPAFVEVSPERRVDFGFDMLMQAPELARQAVAGRPVTLPLVARIPRGNRVDADLEELPVKAKELRDALRLKGYRETARVGPRGTFRLGRGEIRIAFLEGLYPHHALAIAKDGVVSSVLVTGRSNREGTTIVELGRALAAAGAKAAILLDNGGDVGLLRRKKESARSPLTFVARPAEANRARAWPLRACLIYHVGKDAG